MKIILTIIILIISVSVNAEDMLKYLSITRDKIDQGKYEEALERCIWFHNHALEHRPSMAGVRLSFALYDWKELGDLYPPALEALVDMRDSKEKLITEGKDNRTLFDNVKFLFSLGDLKPDVFHDVAAINRILGEEKKTVELFEKQVESEPSNAKRYWVLSKTAIINCKRFDLLKKYKYNPTREFEKVKSEFSRKNSALYQARLNDDFSKEYDRNEFVKDSLELIEIAIALEEQGAAEEIQKQALEIIDDERLKEAITTEQKVNKPDDSPDTHLQCLQW